MSYDPKNRPVFLGRDADRKSPDRLKIGVMHVADDKDNKIEPIPQPETVLTKIMKYSKLAATVLVTLAASALSLEAGGIILPPQVKAVAFGILGIGTILGLTGALDKNKDGKIDEADFK